MAAFPRILVVCVCMAGLVTNAIASYTAAPAKADPQRLRWKDSPIRIAVSSSLSEQNTGIKAGSDLDGAIARSLARWQDAVGIRFILEPTEVRNASPSGESGDGVSLITIAASPENVLLFARDPLSESAIARVFYNRQGKNKGFITEVDIVLNPYQQFSTDGTPGTFDLEATLTHEIGHLLGLRHSSVLGSVMSEGLARNSADGPEARSIALADSDIAAIRELYGFAGEGERCCSVVSGRLAHGLARPAKTLRVWAEDNVTGRVAAQTETALDGTYRLGGLPAGLYSIFWQRSESGEASPIGQLGTVRLSADESKFLSAKVDVQRSDVGLSFIGLNNQLADSAITIGGEREYTVFLGGKDLERQTVRIEFNSPYFRAVPGSMKRYDIGTELSAVSFILAIDPNAPAGLYSLFLTSEDGIMAALVGGLKIAGGSRQ